MTSLRREFGVTHGIASCDTCGWQTQSYKNAQALASIHAKSKGHRVTGEVAYAYTYDGSGKSESKHSVSGTDKQ